MLIFFNNGLNGLNGFLQLGIFNNGLIGFTTVHENPLTFA